jgi:hypothetical protein
MSFDGSAEAIEIPSIPPRGLRTAEVPAVSDKQLAATEFAVSADVGSAIADCLSASRP